MAEILFIYLPRLCEGEESQSFLRSGSEEEQKISYSIVAAPAREQKFNCSNAVVLSRSRMSVIPMQQL